MPNQGAEYFFSVKVKPRWRTLKERYAWSTLLSPLSSPLSSSSSSSSVFSLSFSFSLSLSLSSSCSSSSPYYFSSISRSLLLFALLYLALSLCVLFLLSCVLFLILLFVFIFILLLFFLVLYFCLSCSFSGSFLLFSDFLSLSLSPSLSPCLSLCLPHSMLLVVFRPPLVLVALGSSSPYGSFSASYAYLAASSSLSLSSSLFLFSIFLLLCLLLFSSLLLSLSLVLFVSRSLSRPLHFCSSLSLLMYYCLSLSPFFLSFLFRFLLFLFLSLFLSFSPASLALSLCLSSAQRRRKANRELFDADPPRVRQPSDTRAERRRATSRPTHRKSEKSCAFCAANIVQPTWRVDPPKVRSTFALERLCQKARLRRIWSDLITPRDNSTKSTTGHLLKGTSPSRSTGCFNCCNSSKPEKIFIVSSFHPLLPKQQKILDSHKGHSIRADPPTFGRTLKAPPPCHEAVHQIVDHLEGILWVWPWPISGLFPC